jgi:hypothetical protein
MSILPGTETEVSALEVKVADIEARVRTDIERLAAKLTADLEKALTAQFP